MRTRSDFKVACCACHDIAWDVWEVPNTHPSDDVILVCVGCGSTEIYAACWAQGCARKVSSGSPGVLCVDGERRYIHACYQHAGERPFRYTPSPSWRFAP